MARHPAASGELINPLVAALRSGGRGMVARRPSHAGFRIDEAPGCTLCITNAKGGGVARYLKDRAGAGSRLLLLVPAGEQLAVTSPDSIPLHSFPASETGDLILHELQPARLEVHSTVGWPLGWLERTMAAARSQEIAVSIFLHDYSSICPRVNLVGLDGIYCGVPAATTCASCLQRGPPPPAFEGPSKPLPDVTAWRADWTRLLAMADEVATPCDDARERLAPHFPNIEITVRPHSDQRPHFDESDGWAPLPPLAESAPYRVAVVGGINRAKGAFLLTEIARSALRRRLPLEFMIIGYSMDGRVHRLPNVRITGPYLETLGDSLLAEAQCDVALFPAVWPETHSYALTIPMAANLPVMAFDLGAQAERLRIYGKSSLLPVPLMGEPAQVADRILDFVRATTHSANA
jgi:O-antigen biosynthesis protein